MLHEAGCSGKSLGLGSGQSEPTGQLGPLLALGPWARAITSLSPFLLLSKRENRNLHLQSCCDNSTHMASQAVATQRGPLPFHFSSCEPHVIHTQRSKECPHCPPRDALPHLPSMPNLPHATHTMATLLPSMTTRRNPWFPGSPDRFSSKGVFRASWYL